jgi:NitT/TauT family transport system ATP-binding protein
MQSALSEIWQRTRNTILFVTHDIREAVYLSNRVIVLSGRPARISREVTIDMPTPRDRRDPRFQELELELERAIGAPAH